MNVKKASVSVIIPCYRCSETVERAIESVHKQTLIPKEIILVDDYSNDNTLKILKILKDKYPINWIKIIELPENSGAGVARNIGWENATQNYIAFLDADDSWHLEKIAIQYEFMRNNPDVSLSGHNCNIFEYNKNLKDVVILPFRVITKMNLLLSNKFSTPTVMLKRSLPQRFSDDQRFSEDYNLWLNIIFSDNVCAKSSSKLTYLYKNFYGESGLSSNMREMQKGEISNYKKLYSKGSINIITFSSIFLYSNFKYIKRLITIKIRK